MPVFNSFDHLSVAVNSILSQTYRDLELIIVDDCSEDDSVELIGQLSVLDDRIIPIYNRENKGAGISRNIGIDRAKGEYIAFCDSDDMWVPNKLELQLATMIEKHLDLSYTDVLSVNEDQSELLWRMKGLQDPILEDFMAKTNIAFSSVVLRRKKLAIRFTEDRTRQDAIFLIRLLREGWKFGRVPYLLLLYRVRSNSLSSNKYKAALKVLNVYKKYSGLSIFRIYSLWLQYAINGIRKRIQ